MWLHEQDPKEEEDRVSDEQCLAAIAKEAVTLLGRVVELLAERDSLRAEIGTLRHERDATRLAGIDECIAIIKRRQAHYECYRDGDMMKAKPETFAILDEMLVFLQAHRERSSALQQAKGTS